MAGATVEGGYTNSRCLLLGNWQGCRRISRQFIDTQLQTDKEIVQLMDIKKRTVVFGELFRSKIDSTQLDAALDYVTFNECRLAFETICDYITEDNIALSNEQYDEMIALAQVLGHTWHSGQLSHLSMLVKRP